MLGLTDALRRVREGTEQDRWTLAGAAGYPGEVYRALLTVGEKSVLASLAMNSACPPDVIEEITRRGDSALADFARLNPNAWADTKDPSPLGRQSAYSVDRYLQDRNATMPQRERFASWYKECPLEGGPSVGEVWRSIATSG